MEFSLNHIRKILPAGFIEHAARRWYRLTHDRSIASHTLLLVQFHMHLQKSTNPCIAASVG